MCPGLWLLATVGLPSPWFPGEAPPPHCHPAHQRVCNHPVEQVLREPGTCIGSHPIPPHSQKARQALETDGAKSSPAWPASSPMGSPDAKFLKLRLPGTWQALWLGMESAGTRQGQPVVPAAYRESVLLGSRPAHLDGQSYGQAPFLQEGGLCQALTAIQRDSSPGEAHTGS